MSARGKLGMLAALTLALAVAVLLWRPLGAVRSRTFGPFQLMAQHSPLTSIPGAAEPTNQLLSDPAVQMHPWALFAAGELGQGRLPLWNPYNAAGAPLLANYQSALLSPFTLPYYGLPLKAAVLASALLKLLAAGTFAYLFLRRVGCTPGAALLGGTALASSGFCLLFLQYPHAGVLALLPACLYCAEVLIARCQAQPADRRSQVGAAAWLALAIGTSGLAGHPETLLYGYVVVAAYCAYRVWAPAATRRTGPGPWRASGLLLAAACAGLALAAVQILPFAEYLGPSAALSARRVVEVTLPPMHWPLHFFPNLSGAPMFAQFNAGVAGTNYHEQTAFFVGGVVLLCALLGVFQARAAVAARFFTALVVVWVVYAHDVFGACTWLGTHTPLNKVPATRTHPLWIPSACFLAALGVSALERDVARAGWRRAAACAALAATLGAIFAFGARRYSGELAERRALTPEFAAHAADHVTTMVVLFALGAAGLVAIAGSARGWPRIAGHAALIAAVVVGSALSIAGYVPTVPDEYVYPRTESTEALRELVGEERFLPLSTAHLPAEMNLVYGVRTIECYDAVGIADSLRLIGHFFGGGHMGADPRRATKRGLELLGVRYVSTRGDWVPIDTDLGDFQVNVKNDRAAAYVAYEWLTSELVPFPQQDPELRLDLVASRDGLDGVAVQFIADPALEESAIAFRLTDADQGRELARGERRLGELPVMPRLVPGGWRCELAARFDPLPDSKGRRLQLEISAPGAAPEARPRVLRMPWKREGGPEGAPMVDLGYGQGEFELVGRLGQQSLYRYTRSPGRAWIVGQALSAATHEEAFEIVVSPGFRPLEQVVLERAVEPAEQAGPFELEILDEAPCRWRFAASSATPGWLVVAQAFYPGWKARVDGAERELLRANYGLTAVELPAGRHEVVLEYDSPSVRTGAWCSAVAAGLVALGLVSGRRRRSPGATARPA